MADVVNIVNDRPQSSSTSTLPTPDTSSAPSFELKTPKGTKDYGPAEMAIRERVFSTITNVFKRHGAVTIDTPVFELREVLMGKYGEDSKLIYDLQDQGGELCSLRYDLTVPFARYLAMNRNIGNMKRYHIAKVYRRDQPALTRGRFREFYQCDFDIAGTGFAPLLPDAEIFKVVVEILTELEVGPFRIKCNNRKLLDGMFEACGVEESRFRAICSAVDKLDKTPWEAVRQEMVEEKGLAAKVADSIGNYVATATRSGKKDLLLRLKEDPNLMSSERARQGVEELLVLADYFQAFEIDNMIEFDLSLARGLDYYTGAILEAVSIDGKEGVGSIAGGGRYDNLVGMFSKSGAQIPCVGVSIGVERVFSLLEAKYATNPNRAPRSSPVQVFVAAAGGDLTIERIRLCNALWKAGISAEMSQKAKLKALDQFGFCERNLIPLCVILGPDELAAGKAKIRKVADRTEEVVSYEQVIEQVQMRLKQMGLINSFGALNL